MTILLTEDDHALREGLTELFTREGYQVIAAENARTARSLLSKDIDLIVLDVTLPDGDGVSLCHDWRGAGVETPILFLTAKDDELDVVRGLDAGGNDYVTKPFRMQELLSRVRALTRRSMSQEDVVQRGEFQLDRTHMQVRHLGVQLDVTLTEYKLLSMMLMQNGVTPRNLMLEMLWDAEGRFVDDNTLTVHISRLREKVGAGHIKTVRGVGYRWQD